MQQNGHNSHHQNGPRPKIEPQYVRFVGDSVGVVNLTPAALQNLADQVTQVLMRTINSGKQYALHSRRVKLHGEDVEEALKQLKLDVPIGASSRRGPQLRQFTMPTGEELYVRDEYDMDVTTVLEDQKQKFPIQPYLKAHWLAYEGKLALVPENLRPVKEEEEDDVVPNGTANSKAASIVTRRETAGGAQGAAVSFRASSRVVQTKEHIQIKAPIVESLSVEQQLYIKEIVEAIVGTEEGKRQSALQSLETDTGIQPILPKFSRQVNHAIKCNVLQKCMSMLIYMVRIIRSLSDNPSLKLTYVLHELVPPLMSCMIGRTLCRSPETDNHWALRDYAGKTLIQIVKNHHVGDLRERTLRVLRKVWEDPKSSNPMLYGCINCLLEFTAPGDPFRAEMHQKVQELLQNFSRTPEAMTSMERVEAQKMCGLLSKVEHSLRPRGGGMVKLEPRPSPIF